MEPEKNELTSWKHIAEYLGVNIRNAQRWERELGLPVRRLTGGRQVGACAVELDSWRRQLHARANDQAALLPSIAALNQAGRPPFGRRFRAILTLVAVAALGYSVALTVRPKAAIPTSFTWQHNKLVVIDTVGRAVWQHAFPDAVDQNDLQNTGSFADLDGDGTAELVVLYRPVTRGTKGMALYAFSQDGKPLWRYIPQRTVEDTRQSFAPIYHVRAFRVFPSPSADGSKTWIAVSNVHYWSYLSQVAILDGRGQLVREYWHSGHLDVMETSDLDRDGVHEVLVAGGNAGTSRAVLLVLDPRTMTGASVQPAGDPQGFAPGNETTIVTFPRSQLNRTLEPYNFAYELVVTDHESKFR